MATIADLIRKGAEVRWLWKGWIQEGVANAVAGVGGVGKTRWVADLVRRIRRGLPWPDGEPMNLPPDTKVMWVVAGNHHDELASLCRAFGIEDVVFLNASPEEPYEGVSLDSPQDLRELEARIAAVKPALVIVDTVGNSTSKNPCKAEDARAYYLPLQLIARQQGTTFLCLTHLNAAGEMLGRRILEKVRVAIKLSRPDAHDVRRRAEVVKSNSKVPPALGLTMGDAGNDYDKTPPEAGEPPAGSADKHPLQVEKAAKWLSEKLAGGRQQLAPLRQAAEAAGFDPKTLYRARDKVKPVEEQDDRGRKWWRLPAKGE